MGGREESCQWGPGGWYPHPAASRPRRHRDTDSTRRTRGVAQRHTRAHAGTPGWGGQHTGTVPMQPPAPHCGDVTMCPVGTCGDTRGGMVLAGCWALQPGFGGLTGERGSARLPPRTRDAHTCSSAHTSTGVPTHTLTRTSHPAPLQRSRPARSHARMCQGGRRGGKFGGKQRGTRKEGTTGPTSESHRLHPKQQAATAAPVAAAAPREGGRQRRLTWQHSPGQGSICSAANVN